MTGEWINKLWYVFEIENQLTMGINEWLLCSVAWMDLSNIMWSERHQGKQTT